jgi:dephospho-CoA kinase
LNRTEIWGPAADKLLIVGLTGGIASGKTEVADELARLGARVIDADEITRQVTLPGMSVYKALIEAFGRGIIDENGTINRLALSRIVFEDDKKRKLLNSIIHPEIFKTISREINTYARDLQIQDVPGIVVDAALIVDVGISGIFDLIILVTADEDVRLSRMLDKRGMSGEEGRARIESQVPEAKRLESADIVIDNNGDIEQLRSIVAEVWEELRLKSRQLHP